MDGMLDHLAEELEGKQLLEKPRVSKKVTHVYEYYIPGMLRTTAVSIIKSCLQLYDDSSICTCLPAPQVCGCGEAGHLARRFVIELGIM